MINLTEKPEDCSSCLFGSTVAMNARQRNVPIKFLSSNSPYSTHAVHNSDPLTDRCIGVSEVRRSSCVLRVPHWNERRDATATEDSSGQVSHEQQCVEVRECVPRQIAPRAANTLQARSSGWSCRQQPPAAVLLQKTPSNSSKCPRPQQNLTGADGRCEGTRLNML